MKEIKDKQAVAKLLNQDIHIKGGGVMNLKSLAPKVEKIVDKDPSDDVEEFPYEWVKLPDITVNLPEMGSAIKEVNVLDLSSYTTDYKCIILELQGECVEDYDKRGHAFDLIPYGNNLIIASLTKSAGPDRNLVWKPASHILIVSHPAGSSPSGTLILKNIYLCK